MNSPNGASPLGKTGDAKCKNALCRAAVRLMSALARSTLKALGGEAETDGVEFDNALLPPAGETVLPRSGDEADAARRICCGEVGAPR